MASGRGLPWATLCPVRTDYTAGQVRRIAQRAKDAAQARRLPLIAAAVDGASREEAAKIGGMDRQTLRDMGDPVQLSRDRTVSPLSF